MTIVICQECDDAPAVTRRQFAGVAFYDLCQGCADHWDEHALDTDAGWSKLAAELGFGESG